MKNTRKTGNVPPDIGLIGPYTYVGGCASDVFATLFALGESNMGYHCGLMWTACGPYVIEFDVRFGDPETQVLMPRIDGDFAKLLMGAAAGAIDETAATVAGDACVGVVLATTDYPRTSVPLAGLCADVSLGEGRAAFWGTSTLRDGVVDASGGRVLTVTARGDDLAHARTRAYAAIDELAGRMGSGLPLTYRSDIAKL